MSLVQKLNVGGGQTTFGMVVSSLLSMALHEGSQSKRIDVVFDTYREMSIKNAERKPDVTYATHSLDCMPLQGVIP